MKRYRVAILVGSVRRDSINRRLALALTKLGQEHFDFAEVRIDDLPFANPDLEGDLPEPVRRLRREIGAADAVLFVTPEYNRSVPGVLKNAIDWASRPYRAHSLGDKPGAVIGTSMGRIGTATAQQHLRTILAPLDVYLMGQPEGYIVYTPGLIDDAGTVTDGAVREFLQQYIDQFAAWVARVARA
ncbi:MAG TPA: NADPH-dependent FMN reductase [Roseiflexaceae bacterium]|nr:NADPH-dependent FMN reductase [Roseiflexaceae bacterium]